MKTISLLVLKIFATMCIGFGDGLLFGDCIIQIKCMISKKQMQKRSKKARSNDFVLGLMLVSIGEILRSILD